MMFFRAPSYLDIPKPRNLQNPILAAGKQAALERLRNLNTNKVGQTPTINRLIDLYDRRYFVRHFWNAIGEEVKLMTVADLVPVMVNPMKIKAGQDSVELNQVKELLQLKVRSEFWPTIHAITDPNQPIIVLNSPVGFISVNGHHRIRALQLRMDRRVQVYTLAENHYVNEWITDVFGRYGYTNNLKRTA
jgi:hypothetical protein